MSEAVAEIEVRGQIIPLDGMYMVLPNTAIAEVVSYSEPDPMENKPDWMLGNINWRGATIPLIGFETISAQKTSQINERCRIIMLNSIDNNDRMPFYGILSQDIPRLININESIIQEDTNVKGQPSNYVLSHTVIDGQQAIIPDQSALEAAILNAI